MKNLKKVLALVIALTMVLTTVAFASYPDVDADANYASAVELLSALEILQGDENGNFNPDNTITRAEYAAVVCRALGMENAANSAKGATIFTDVAADHWATGYINLASQQGIVNGKGNGIFDPEGNVTYAEAVKMLVVALGYEPMAASRGGYPTGYLTVANSTKITANVSSSGTDTAALRSTVAQLTANALEVANMDQTGFGTDTKFEVLDDYDNYTTLLTKMDIYKATGVVEDIDASDGKVTLRLTEASDDYEFGYSNNKGDAYSDFSSDPNSKDYHTVDFNTNGVDADAYLQQSVDVYVYKAGKSDYDVVYITASGIGSSLKIDADDLAKGKATLSTKRTVVEYYENSDATKTTKIDVEGNVPVYVNGFKVPTSNITYDVDLYTLLEDTGATVEFVENSDDKYYDMILINVYQHGIVDEASASKEKITFVGSNPGSVKFDSDDSKQVVTMTDKNGNAITLDDIKKDDVLAMLVKGDNTIELKGSKLKAPTVKGFAEKSNEITVIDLGNNTVTGSIDSSDEDTIYIDGTEYDLAKVFADDNKDKIYNETKKEAKLGTEGTFYLDINGKVIGFDGTTGGNTSFGYILQAEYNTSNSFDKGWEVKMLTEKNGIVTFTMNSSYTINDVDGKSANDTGATTKTTEADKFLSAFGGKTDFNKTAIKDRLVEYKVTSDNKIKSLDKLATIKDVFNDKEFKDSTTKIGNFVLDEDVVVFNLDESDIDDVTVGDLSTLVDEGTYSGFVADDVASTTSDYGVLVLTKGATKFAAEDGFFVVTGKKTSTLGDKDSVVVTYYDVEGTEKTATFTDDSKKKGTVEYSNLKKGDVFVANMNSESVVKDYAVLAQFDTAKNQILPIDAAFKDAYGTDFTKGTFSDGVVYVYGYITKISTSGKTVIDVNFGGKEDSFAIGKDAGTFSYAQGKNGTIKADWDGTTVEANDKDKNDCTFVFLKLYDGTVTDVYTVDIRQATSGVTGKTSAVAEGTSSGSGSTGTGASAVKEEVKEETPVVEVPVAEEDFE